MNNEREIVIINTHGDTAEQIRGSSAGYAEYLARNGLKENPAASSNPAYRGFLDPVEHSK